MSPDDASQPENESGVRNFRYDRQMKNYAKHADKYDAIPIYKIGDLVMRRLREKGGHVIVSGMKQSFVKESSKKFNVSKTVYEISKIYDTFPLLSYTLTQKDSGVALPGRVTATDLIPAPLS